MERGSWSGTAWVWLAFVASCDPGGGARPPPPAAPAPDPAPAPAPMAWAPPSESAIPEGPSGDAIRRGLDLFTHTSERLPEYAPGNISCSNCHLDAGRRAGAAPVAGAHARFPKYMDRTGAVIPLHDRVNYCFTRSLAGSRLPVESREMTDLLSYIAWMSLDVPQGGDIAGQGMPKMPPLTGDAMRGAELYAETCAVCHGADGEGRPGAFPAVWGPGSYSIGASMAREERAASFIRQFMPQTAPGTLTDQEAFDLAAFVNGKPRPDSPGKQNDWPAGGAPVDVPYATQGHEPHRPPPLLERADPELAIVPAPRAVAGAP